MTGTAIKSADRVVAWDEGSSTHVYRRGVDIAFADDRIAFVGRNYWGPADRVVDGRDRLVLPGLVDIHSHPEHEPLYRGVREEHGLRNMHMTGLYERSQAFSATDEEARAASAEFAYCELLLCGVTSFVDISPAWDGWIELFAKSGLRGFLAPGYASARWRLGNDFALEYAWDEARGQAGFAAVLALIDQAARHPCALRNALFLDTHSWIQWWTRTDLALIAETSSSVAHCPTPFGDRPLSRAGDDFPNQ